MSDNSTVNREERIAELQAELQDLQSEAIDEVSDVAESTEEVLTEAEETVVESAEEVQQDTSEAHQTLSEAEREIESTVEETAHEAADELGHPEQAEAIAEHLFRRLDERGILPHTQHHATLPVSEAEEAAEIPVEATAEIPAEAEHVAAEVTDVPPEPNHWYFRPLRFRKR